MTTHPIETDLSFIAEVLKSKRKLLFLGQDFLDSRETRKEYYRLFSLQDEKCPPYDAWLESNVGIEPRSGKLHEHSKAFALTPPMIMLGKIHWDTVFTSAIDSVLTRMLSLPDRRSAFSSFDWEPCDADRLRVARLFGCVDQDNVQLPPIDRKQMMRRTVSASSQFATGLSNLMDPLGYLFIDGWNPATDWFDASEFPGDIRNYAPDQVLLFGIAPDSKEYACLERDKKFGLLIEEKRIRLFERRLGDYVAEIAENDDSIFDVLATAPEQVSLPILTRTPSPGNHAEPTTVFIPLKDFSRWSETVQILTETYDCDYPLPQTNAELDQQFLDFHSGRPTNQLEKVSRYIFPRKAYKEPLLHRVDEILIEDLPQETTLIVEGESGIGKSSLLAKLAIDLRKKRFPVVYTSNTITAPNFTHLDELVFEIEKTSGITTVLIWDGMVHPDKYQSLSRYFATRGRRVLVIGSSYILSEEKKKNLGKDCIHVADELDESEKQGLKSYFRTLAPDLHPGLEKKISESNRFFDILYYSIPIAQDWLRDSVKNEHEYTLNEMSNRLVQDLEMLKHSPRSGPGLFDHVAHLATSEGEALQEEMKSDDNIYEAVSLLFRAIIITSIKYGKGLPAVLGDRLLHVRDQYVPFELYRNILTDRNCFFECDENGILVPKSALKNRIMYQFLKLTADDLIGNIEAIMSKIDPLKELIHKSLRSSVFLFVSEVFNQSSPNSRDYSRADAVILPKIARIIRNLRERSQGKIHPNFIVMELNFWRESIKERLLNPQDTETTIKSMLDLIESTQQRIEERQFEGDYGHLKRDIATEKAALLGTLLKQRIGDSNQPERRIVDVDQTNSYKPLLDETMRAIDEGLRENDENIYLMDIACWVYEAYSQGVLKKQSDARETARIVAKWQQILDNYEQTEMSESQKTTFKTRRTDFQDCFDKKNLFPVIKEEIESNPPIGHYLLARYYLHQKGDGFGPKKAFEYLEGEEVKSYVFTNTALFRLYYRLWWEIHTEKYLDSAKMVGFFNPDQPILIPDLDWSALLDLAERRCSFEGESENRIGLFHRAWSFFQLGKIEESLKVFRILNDISQDSIRRARSLAIVSGENGKMAAYQGTLKVFGEKSYGLGESFRKKGQIYWPEKRLSLTCNPQDFHGKGNGSQVDFCISLNYIGCFAISVNKAKMFLGR